MLDQQAGTICNKHQLVMFLLHVLQLYVCLSQNLQTDSRKRAGFPTAPCKSFLQVAQLTYFVP